jgi:ABC-type dipeptide/oligopeptide/nickel transport system permease subunit
MRMHRFAATSLLTIAATAITAATANAQPSQVDPVAIRGSDHGVTYTSTLSQNRTGITTTLGAGRFAETPDATAVAITAPDGATIGRVPLAYDVAGRRLALTPTIAAGGTKLTLTPTGRTAPVRDARAFNNTVKAEQTSAVVLLGFGLDIVVGVVVGALIGAVIGLLVGALFLIVGAIPGVLIGLAVGAVVGGAIGVAL